MSQSDVATDSKPPAHTVAHATQSREATIEQLAAQKFARSRKVAFAAITLTAAAVIGVLALIVTLWLLWELRARDFLGTRASECVCWRN